MNVRNKGDVFKIGYFVFFAVQTVLYFSDFVHFISWKYEINLYKVMFFLKEKPYKEDDGFIYGVSVFTEKLFYIAIASAVGMIIMTVVGFKITQLTLPQKAGYIIGIILAALVAFIILKYHDLCLFYDSPVDDLPWDYREIVFQNLR